MYKQVRGIHIIHHLLPDEPQMEDWHWENSSPLEPIYIWGVKVVLVPQFETWRFGSTYRLSNPNALWAVSIYP